MTSDAKIGLLLGLVFIFIIAFIINGLPNFHKDARDTSNELTNSMVSLKNNSVAIGMKGRDIVSSPAPTEKPSALPVTQPVLQHTISDSKPSLPQSPLVAKEADVPKSTAAPANVYVVCSGDSLAGIAKKFYGVLEGNKKINIERIFEANRDQLKSQHEIYVGQKLIIPPLPVAASTTIVANKNPNNNILSNPMLEEVKSIGQRHLEPVVNRTSENTKPYVVQSNDTLWQIAAEKLGEGSRYKEIIKLNKELLSDKNTLVVGMHLKIPPQ